MTTRVSPHDERWDDDDAVRGQLPSVALGAPAVRARTCPVAILLVWAWEALLALVVGSVFASVASQAYRSHPDLDLPLFRPGRLALLDLIVHSDTAEGPLVLQVVVFAVVAILVGLFAGSFLLAAMSYARIDAAAPPLGHSLGRAARAYPASLVVLVLTRVTQVMPLGMALMGGAMAVPHLQEKYGEATGQKWVIAIAAVGIVLAAMLGVAGDLARAAVIRFDLPGIVAFAGGWRAFARRPIALTWSWCWRAVAWVTTAIAGGVVAARVSDRLGLPLAAAAVVHEVVLLAGVAVKASWGSRSLRAVIDAERKSAARR